jgi:hypothetical protein
MRFEKNVDAAFRAAFLQADFSVNEAKEMLNPIQDGLKLELNSWSPFGQKVGCYLFTNSLASPAEISYSLSSLLPVSPGLARGATDRPGGRASCYLQNAPPDLQGVF